MRASVKLAAFGIVFVVVSATFLPSTALAQASLAGVARDASGAVLPGVTVEAASPVLIEKVRTAVTDGAGQYRIIDLRPGTYAVTFTLAGFTTLKREGVQLSGESVVTLNPEMRVGGVEETITVTGESPTIDVQTTTRQQVISRDVINTLPTGRNYNTLGQLLTAVTPSRIDSGGALGDPMVSLSVHGSRDGDQRVMQNGVSTMTLQAGGNIGIAVPNPGMASEVTVDTSGASAELTTGGIRINYIPRDGGNRFTGTTFVTFANSDMQSDNLTSEHKAKGLTSVTRIRSLWDINPGLGGPIRKDRLWFFFTARANRADNYPANAYYNKNAYDPTKWTYEADLSRPASNRNLWTDAQIRLTAQLNPKNKVGFTWDQQDRCSCPGSLPGLPWNITATTSPEAAGNMRSPTQRLMHAEWSSPVTSKLLLEAVTLHRTERWGFMPNSTAYTDAEVINGSQETLLRSGGLIPVLDSATGRFYRSTWVWHNSNWVPNYYFRAAGTYVTGRHQLKVGLSDVPGFVEEDRYNFTPISYIAIPGAPITVIRETTWSQQPRSMRTNQRWDLGVFAQDRVTLNRLTLNLGVRFDAYSSGSPEQLVVGKTPLTPNRADITFPETVISSWKDVTPRLGAVYDVRGNGKTALKVSLNKYLQGQTAGGAGVEGSKNPVERLVSETTRVWVNGGNFTRAPNCDLTNPNANGECGPIANPLFGQNDPNALRYADDYQFGWGKRQFNWELSAGVQHEILPRVSVEAAYFRRAYGHWTVTDNTALTASQHTRFTVTAPASAPADLQGQTFTAVDANARTKTELVDRTRQYGDQFERWSGMDVTVNARLQNGILLFGGVSTGRMSLNNCDTVAAVPESLTRIVNNVSVAFSPDNCNFTQPFLTQMKANGSYTVRKADVLLSVTYQSLPGPVVRADATVTQRAPGQPLVGNSSLLVPLVPVYYALGPSLQLIGKEYGDRLHQVDLRVGKLLRWGRTRTSINLDVFNLFNGHAATAENNRVESYRQPTEIQLARFVKIGAQFDF